MSKAKHTPGKWVIDESHPEMEGIQIWANTNVGDTVTDTVIIAHVVPDKHMQHEANAKLIAAAPELLEALQDLVEGETVGMGKKAMALRFQIASDIIKVATT